MGGLAIDVGANDIAGANGVATSVNSIANANKVGANLACANSIKGADTDCGKDDTAFSLACALTNASDGNSWMVDVRNFTSAPLGKDFAVSTLILLAATHSGQIALYVCSAKQ